MSTIEQTTIPAGTWELDPVHSKAAFSVKHSGIATFRGSFKEVDGRLEDGVLTGSVKVASVDVPVEQLIGHLQSPDFFDAERHPRLTFESREIERVGDDVVVRGEITMKGHTEPVELRGTVADAITDPFGNDRFGLRVQTTVDRTLFDISWNNPLPSGEPALSNDVTIAADLQFVKGS